jgi:hypothetical protein
MSKFTALAIGILSIISIVPTAQAATSTGDRVSLHRPAADLHAQVIIRLGGPPAPYHRDDFDRRRQWQIEREREADRRREFYSRRHRERQEFHQEGGEFRGEPRGSVQVEFRGGSRPEGGFRPEGGSRPEGGFRPEGGSRPEGGRPPH